MIETKPRCQLPSPARRRFLKTVAGTTLLFSTGSLQFALADAAEVAAVPDGPSPLDAKDARTLLAVARTLFPHEFLGDSVYAQAVERLADAAAASAASADLLRGGLERLPRDFAERDVAAREAALEALRSTSFFKLTRATTVDAVYGNPDVWRHFGYPGPSLPFGGWLHREQLDIDWLPELPSR